MSVFAGFAPHAIVEPADVEGIARLVLREAGQDGNDRPDMDEVADRLGSPVLTAQGARTGAWTDLREMIIFCRPFTKAPLFRPVAIAHELAHLGWEMDGTENDLQDESIVDQIARAILIPNIAQLRAVVRLHGTHHHPLVAALYPHLPPLIVAQRATDLDL